MVGLLGFWATLGLACQKSGSAGPGPGLPPCGSGTCIADPYVHCVASGTCQDSSECPAGLSCDPQALDGGCGDAGQCMSRQCAIGVPGPVDVLSSGFATQEAIDVHVAVVGGYAQLSWTAPKDAQTVACALFACPPEVAERSSSLQIVNFNQCVLAFAIKPATGSYVDLGDSQYDSPGAAGIQATCGGAVEAGAPVSVITALSVGCWAYSSTTLVAASDLTTIPAYEAIATSKVFAAACGGSDDGLNCLTAAGSFGTCSAGDCKTRCLGPRDCAGVGADGPEDAGDANLADASLGAPETCVAPFDSFAFGLCVEGDGG